MKEPRYEGRKRVKDGPSENQQSGRGISRRRFLSGTGTMALGAIGRAGPLAYSGPRANEKISAIAVGHEYREDDMPSIAASPDGTFWVTWLSFNSDRDDVGIRQFRNDTWQNLLWVPGTSGDSWLPQVAVDDSNRVWVVWSQQVEGNWDIYARRFDPSRQRWGRLERLTKDRLPDINPRVWSDGRGKAAVVWQGFRKRSSSDHPNSNIFLRILEGSEWSSEIRITDRGANDWEPAAAIDSKGAVWVAYDSYITGNYDVFLTKVQNGRVQHPEVPIAATPDFEARATIAVDSEDRVWVAWEAGRPNWGKSNGHILGWHGPGVVLGGFREPRIACYDRGHLLEPAMPLASAFQGANTYQPTVFSDGRGSVWVVAKMLKMGPPPRSGPPQKLAYWEYWKKTPCGYWEYWITHLDGREWRQAIPLPQSKGRSSTRMAAALGVDDRLWLTWPTDNRRATYYHRPIRQQVYTGTLEAPNVEPRPLLKVRMDPSTMFSSAHSDEAVDVRLLREYSTLLNEKPHRLLRGDLHRHTELSWDEGGQRDGSLQDFYRYMIDAGLMDFGASTDHQGGAWPYWWWYSQKMTDMYHVPGTYVGLFSHERSTSYPYGHHNVFFAKRGDSRVIPFFMEDGVSLYAFPLTSEGDVPADETPQVVKNDTELLFEEVRAHRGITIPHTTGTGFGTDWHAHDPEVQPVVEIFQGLRQSYEEIGAPYCATMNEVNEDEARDAAALRREGHSLEYLFSKVHRIRPDGMVSKAWEKGYKLGVITSSDHISTHLSFAMVYTDDPTREGIIEAIRRRHTYGATDNILLEVWMGEHFMGDVFDSSVPLPLHIKARGTDLIATVDVIKDGKVICSVKPNQRIVDLKFQDPNADHNRHHYYVRLLQRDGMIAWSSPLFVNWK